MKIVPASIEIISTEPYEGVLKRVERAAVSATRARAASRMVPQSVLSETS